MSTLAFDLGTYSIKVLIGKAGHAAKVEKAFEVLNPTGLAVPGDDAQVEQLRQVMSALWQDYALPKAELRLSLPESVVATKVIAIPPLSDSELASAIHWQAERNIPIPKEELSLQYQVISRPTGKENSNMQVLLVGARKPLIERYISLFQDVGVEPNLVETQALSVYRNVGVAERDPVTMITHLGANELVLQVVAQGKLNFVVSHMGGGNLLTKTLQSTLNLESGQTEQYVRAYGLDETQFEGKVKDILLPQAQEWLRQMRIAMQYYANENTGASVQRVVLSGGVATLRNFASLISAELGVEVLVAAPFGTTTTVENVPNPPSFTVAMGLLQYEE